MLLCGLRYASLARGNNTCVHRVPASVDRRLTVEHLGGAEPPGRLASDPSLPAALECPWRSVGELHPSFQVRNLVVVDNLPARPTPRPESRTAVTAAWITRPGRGVRIRRRPSHPTRRPPCPTPPRPYGRSRVRRDWGRHAALREGPEIVKRSPARICCSAIDLLARRLRGFPGGRQVPRDASSV